MSKRDYYEVLGLKKDASESDIKKAYRNLAKEFHPDKNPDNESAKELFQEIQEAYETLSDSSKKAKYDRFGHSSPQQEFNGFRYEKPVRHGENMRLVIKLSLEEIYNGVEKSYKFKRNTKCHSCHGHGGTDMVQCPTCQGGGVVLRIIRTPFGDIRQPVPCSDCDMIGEKYKKECSDCKGSGLESVEETIKLTVPHGIEDGTEFVYRDYGHAVKSGEHGDLIIKVMEIPHKVFKRTSAGDLQMNLKLTYPQLVLGDKVDIETIDGGKIRIAIPEHSDVGANLRVPTKGMKPYKSDTRGDLTITLGIDIPKQISETTKELLNKLKDIV